MKTVKSSKVLNTIDDCFTSFNKDALEYIESASKAMKEVNNEVKELFKQHLEPAEWAPLMAVFDKQSDCVDIYYKTFKLAFEHIRATTIEHVGLMIEEVSTGKVPHQSNN